MKVRQKSRVRTKWAFSTFEVVDHSCAIGYWWIFCLHNTSQNSMYILNDNCNLRGKSSKWRPFWMHYNNKKVLLRERKRHTARRVARARYADLSGGEYPVPCPGGYPVPCWGGGYSIPCPGGYPMPGLGHTPSQVRGGYPILGFGGYPISGPPPDLRWGTPPQPHLGWGTPLARPGMGYPPYHPDLDRVPPPEMLTDRHLWKQYLPIILRMRTVTISATVLFIVRAYITFSIKQQLC